MTKTPEGIMTAHPYSGEGVIHPIVLIEKDSRFTLYRRRKIVRVSETNKLTKQKAQGNQDQENRHNAGSSTIQVEICSVTLGAVDGRFEKCIKLTKVHKP